MSKTSPDFEIPPEMRAFAEQAVAQAKQAFDGFLAVARRMAATAENQAVSAGLGVKDLGELALGFAERNIASSFEFAQKLLAAKDIQEVMALHADYVRQQTSALAEQAKDLSQHAAKMAAAGSKGG